MRKKTIFISYSRKDKKWLDQIKKYLSILEFNYNFLLWEDSKIETGVDWKNEIYTAIENSDLALLLVSSNFLSSKFIQTKEVPKILQSRRSNNLIIYNVIINPCALELSDLHKFQCLNDINRPLQSLKPINREFEFVRMTKEIKHILESNENSFVDVKNDILDIKDLIILKRLSQNANMSITEIEKSVISINRKNLVLSLTKLLKNNYIEKFKDPVKKEASVYWRPLNQGFDMILDFEKEYFSKEI